MRAGTSIRKRLKSLERHLKEENPVLVSVVGSFRRLDKIGYSMGLLDKNESFATQISWWPLISVLGTFSAGKSTFINHYLGGRLQETGNQAVDDKFTVVCYSNDAEPRVLPGLALDADPRFPFYQIGQELDKVAPGEGERIDAYLQLKTMCSDAARGRILIDSPGFDADSQRSATLRLTRHIVDLSDLVLVFFDARHPEPGAMTDTLTHLVKDTIGRTDSNKFMYVLNQIDTTAREDNPEDVYGAWQRAIAQEGLTTGRFYSIYNPEAAIQIEDAALRKRFESKRDVDLAEIHKRMNDVSTDRAYRIIGALDKTAKDIELGYVPQITSLISRWGRSVLKTDAVVYGLLVLTALGGTIYAGYWEGMKFAPPWLDQFVTNLNWKIAAAVGVIGMFVLIHFYIRGVTRKKVLKYIKTEFEPGPDQEKLSRAFFKNTRFWKSIFSDTPVGWGRFNRGRLQKIIISADQYIQALNDKFTDPSGEHAKKLAQKDIDGND